MFLESKNEANWHSFEDYLEMLKKKNMEQFVREGQDKKQYKFKSGTNISKFCDHLQTAVSALPIDAKLGPDNEACVHLFYSRLLNLLFLDQKDLDGQFVMVHEKNTKDEKIVGIKPDMLLGFAIVQIGTAKTKNKDEMEEEKEKEEKDEKRGSHSDICWCSRPRIILEFKADFGEFRVGVDHNELSADLFEADNQAFRYFKSFKSKNSIFPTTVPQHISKHLVSVAIDLSRAIIYWTKNTEDQTVMRFEFSWLYGQVVKFALTGVQPETNFKIHELFFFCDFLKRIVLTSNKLD